MGPRNGNRGPIFISSPAISWTAWNHVRTATALAAAVLLTIALLD